jgi:hypothetical protein
VCLRAAGRNGGLTAGQAGDGAWKVLDTPGGEVTTWATSVPGQAEEVVFAVLTATR